MSRTHFRRAKIEQIRFEKLCFSYEQGEAIFQQIDFEFPVNQYVWVRAAQSGAGRSTLLQILAGLVVPTSGSYFINQQDVCNFSFEEFLPYRMMIGYAFDMGGLLHNKTLYENLVLPLQYHNVLSHTDCKKNVLQYMEEMNIVRYRDHRPSGVQGGVRKIACLIRALLLNPEFLLLDDPTLGLGQEAIAKYFNLIEDLRKQGFAKHVFVSTFDEKLMASMDHQQIFIENKSLQQALAPKEKKVVHL